MRHLIGIISCKMTKSMEITVDLLKKQHDFVIHVDKKTSIEEYDRIKKYVCFLENRIDVRWGEFSQVEATLEIILYAKENKYDYVSIISESDLPMMNSQEMLQFLIIHKGSEFIGMKECYDSVPENLRYRYFSFLHGRSNLFRKIYKFFKINKLFKNKYLQFLPTIYKGNNWMSLSHDACSYVVEFLKNNKEYIQAFKESFLSDEIFFHTILLNSPFKDKIYKKHLSDEYISSARYILWSGGGSSGPEQLYAEKILDYKQDKNFLFFRKISDKSDFKSYLDIIDKREKYGTD